MTMVNGVMAAIAAALVVGLLTMTLPVPERKTDAGMCDAYRDWSIRRNIKMKDLDRQCRQVASMWWQR